MIAYAVSFCAVAAAAFGFVGAHYWLKSSQVPLLITGDWSGNPELNAITREADVIGALLTAGRLNALGARWTSAAALAAAISAVLSAI